MARWAWERSLLTSRKSGIDPAELERVLAGEPLRPTRTTLTIRHNRPRDLGKTGSEDLDGQLRRRLSSKLAEGDSVEGAAGIASSTPRLGRRNRLPTFDLVTASKGTEDSDENTQRIKLQSRSP